jgi:hypothetical protein
LRLRDDAPGALQLGILRVAAFLEDQTAQRIGVVLDLDLN